jgi:hypothetical protein
VDAPSGGIVAHEGTEVATGERVRGRNILCTGLQVRDDDRPGLFLEIAKERHIAGNQHAMPFGELAQAGILASAPAPTLGELGDLLKSAIHDHAYLQTPL